MLFFKQSLPARANEMRKRCPCEHHSDSEAYGITPPISTAQPTEKDLKLSEQLTDTLKDFDVFESAEESELRCVPVLASFWL